MIWYNYASKAQIQYYFSLFIHFNFALNDCKFKIILVLFTDEFYSVKMLNNIAGSMHYLYKGKNKGY